MANKKALFNIKGMTRDLAVSKFNPQFAYENHNLRIVATDSNDTLALVNEKGNVLSEINWEDESPQEGNYVFGTPIGQEILDNNLVLFTAGEDTTIDDIPGEESSYEDISAEVGETIVINDTTEDYIYKFWLDANRQLHGKRLFAGNLNFDKKHPIETLSLYENEELKKIYWVDGINQPRVINIEATDDQIESWSSDSFNFVRKLNLKEVIFIDRDLLTGGIFAPGTIQYCLTYFSIYGQESNIFYTSPLFYTSYNDRGASAEDTVSNSFKIYIRENGLDSSFDYVRIYAIHRTSLDSTPQVRKLVDISIKSLTDDIQYVDTGIEGESVDITHLLYVGGIEIIGNTLTQKDNTLFLGGIEKIDTILSSDIKDGVENQTIHFINTQRELDYPDAVGLYPYDNQLKYSSNTIKTFKYQEVYRFGFQAQHKTGVWSDVAWINDVSNDAHPNIRYVGGNNPGYKMFLPQAYFELNNASIISKLASSGYVKVRPVVVFPKVSERAVLCQGVLAPTVYNVGDRSGNAPFAQSSWFFRPNSYLDVDNCESLWLVGGSNNPYDSWAAQVRNDNVLLDLTSDYIIRNFNKGKWVEFRHNHPIPSNNKENAEIQCISNPPSTPYIGSSTTDDSITLTWVSQNSENYYVDQSIVTLHSPDIEFDNQLKNLDTSNLKLRIVGYVPITASASDIDIQTSTPVNNFCEHGGDNESQRSYYNDFPIGFYKEPIGVDNLSTFGYRGIISGGFWFDDLSGYRQNTGNTNKYSTGFVVYPWHRNGSLNNNKFANSSGYRSAMLKQKKLSVLRYSYNTEYFETTNDDMWEAYVDGSSVNTGISDVVIFDSNEMSLVKLKGPKNSGIDTINYYGNIDKIITYPRIGSKKEGYPIVTTGTQNTDTNAHLLLTGNYILPDDSEASTNLEDFTEETTGLDPVSMKYKSSPHAVLALNYTETHQQRILPTNKYGDGFSQYEANSQDEVTSEWAFWDKSHVSSQIKQECLSKYPNFGYLWLGELYNDSISEDIRFGGQSNEAFENNQWLPAGEAISLFNSNGNLKTALTLNWTEGDTYYQRYDCLKTYPFTEEDQNSVVDILSFMVETRINIDGRYDKNRGQVNNLYVSPTNFNLLNSVYSQQNNIFNYRSQNPDKLLLNSFPNTIAWSKTKTLGEEVDTWTNITLASTLDLDGDKGPLRALKNYNNTLLTFQDNGISQILYNENVQIASTTGVPIEIANSGKVSGKRYISNHIGCTNKWSICTSPNGIYFLDSLRKDFYLFNGQFNNLSDNLGFHSWIINNITDTSIWNPKDFNSCVTLYDRINGDVLITTDETSLAYSEPLQQFSSFYDYQNTPYFSNLEDVGIAWHKNSNNYYAPWLHRQGEYNKFFGEYKPFWTTVIVNSENTMDKIFNTLEYRADGFTVDANNKHTVYDDDYNFNYLKTWNEYQEGESYLNDVKCAPSNLKKKFRIWRANIPRWNIGEGANNLDRMRNPWLYLQLKMQDNSVEGTPDTHLSSDTKVVLHDLVVDYFE